MSYSRTVFILLLVFLVATAATALASQCINCHTDAEKLKTIAATIQRPEASAETAGKG